MKISFSNLITNLFLNFQKAPASMKSVVSAAWLLTTALGNLFVVIITENVTFESQVSLLIL